MKKAILLSVILIVISASFGLTVYDIQFSETGDSPYMGETVEVSGVVMAPGFQGDKYYISDPEGGPWHGVYVYDFDNTVELGDFITITCEVDEYYDLTELKNLTAFRVDSSVAVPPAYTTTCSEASTSESLEGVLVTIADVTVGIDTAGDSYINDGTGSLKFGDGFDYSYSPSDGDEFDAITGVMYYTWGEFVLMPRSDDDFEGGGTTPELVSIHDIQYTTEDESPYYGDIVTVTGIVTATGYNGVNYFISDGTSGPWSGLYVYDRDHTPVMGQWLTLTGEIDEYYGLTELKNVTYFNVDSTGDVPSPHVCTIPEATAEEFEACLVAIEIVTVFNIVDEDEYIINDGMNTMPVLNAFDVDYSPIVDDVIFSITGMMTFSWSEFKICPRSSDDYDFEAISIHDKNPIPEYYSVQAYPNPFNGSCYIDNPNNETMVITDINGKVVERTSGSLWTPSNNIESGVYKISNLDNETSCNVIYIK